MKALHRSKLDPRAQPLQELYSVPHQPCLGNWGLTQCWALLAWRSITAPRCLDMTLAFNIIAVLYCNYSTNFTLKFYVFSAKTVCLENRTADIIWVLGNGVVYFIAKVKGEVKAILSESQLSAICISAKILKGFPEEFSICVMNRSNRSFQNIKTLRD